MLGHLNERDGLGNAELADRLFVTRPSVSALLERLERNGFIRREISLADRRGIRILLEPAGRDAVNSVRDEVRQYAASLMEGLPEEQVKSLTNSMAVANSESEVFKREAGELKLRMEALGIDAAGSNKNKIEQRLLKAVSDLKIVQDEKDKLAEQLVRLSEAVVRFLKTAASTDADARMALETEMRGVSE